MKPKCLYVMHTDWDWILQRPQILGSLLCNAFDMHFVCIGRLFKHTEHKVKNEKPDNFMRIRILPKQYQYPSLLRINKSLFNIQLGDLSKYDYIWISYPEFIEYIPEDYQGEIIYDCMDDYAALTSSDNREAITRSEKQAIERSCFVFASSEHLLNRITKTNSNATFKLLRNGFVPGDRSFPAIPKIKNQYVITYFGTISTWMNIEGLCAVCNSNSKISVRLIGPTEIEQVEHKGLEWIPPVDHSDLAQWALTSDCLIMPFLLNDAILAVDPVKLYEYINFGKCIISIYYDEIARFADYVYFYQTDTELVDLVNDLANAGFPPKYDSTNQEKFLNKNTWPVRAKEAINTITENHQ